MKVQIELFGITYTAEAEASDQSLDECFADFIKPLLSAVYDSKMVDAYFSDGEYPQ